MRHLLIPVKVMSDVRGKKEPRGPILRLRTAGQAFAAGRFNPSSFEGCSSFFSQQIKLGESGRATS
jgi:hypothetical protein